MDFDYLTDYDRALDSLAASLGGGTLVLFLGAGVSSGARLPNWRQLIEYMREEVGLPNDSLTSNADDLQHAADEVRRKFYADDESGFADLVQNCLYRGISLDDAVLGDRLLTAVGALLMGSRRGSIKRVVTFNFDSLLESYVWLNGFVPKVIFQPPGDEGAEDVRLYHPHGFLPHPNLKMKGSGFVILDSKSINLRIGEQSDPWLALLRHVLLTGTGLFVGLSLQSFRDRALAPVLSVVGERLKTRRPHRPTGFWLLKSEGAKDIDVNNEFLDSGIVPVRFSEYEDVPKILLEICQRAARAIPVPGQQTVPSSAPTSHAV